MDLVSLQRQSIWEKENSNLKATGPPGWGLDIGLTSLFQKISYVMETATEEIDTTGCNGLPESSQDTYMNVSGESRKETNDRKMEVLSAKTKTRIGFWNVRTMFETGKLAQVTAEMRSYNLHILGISESRLTGSGRFRTNTGEMVLYSGRDDHQHHEGGKEWRSA